MRGGGAEGVAARHGRIFWYLTLLCGFLVLGPGVVQTVDGVCRRWTDVVWSSSQRLRRAPAGRAHVGYYIVMLFYCAWGLLALGLTPDPLVLAILGSSLGNVGLAISALHTIAVNRTLLPRKARPPWILEATLAAAALYFLGISALAFEQQWRSLTSG